MRLALATDNRLRPFMWLLASAGAQVITFWYPDYVAHKYPSPDSRYFILPEVVLGVGVVAAVSLVLLLARLFRHSKTRSIAIAIIATVTGAVALIPICKVFVR